MVGTSKRNIVLTKDENAADIFQKNWNVGIYARLSVDSQDKKSESIDTQIEISKAHMGKFDDMDLYDCYCDLGKTGTNFEREEFERMMMDIRQQKVNCVIVKDFSRLGRNYIETGNYIEKIFPFLQVRFISVTDNYDSVQNKPDADQMVMNLKNIVNELYARDIAQKVKAAKKVKQEMGSYTGSAPPYGYSVRNVDGKRVLFPEEITADIIRKIFDMYVSGCRYRDIVQELLDKRIQRPMIYYRTGQIYCPKNEKLQEWGNATIRWILRNPVYIGSLIQSRIQGKDYAGHELHRVNDKDISEVENTHEPLISEEIFIQAQKRLEKQSVYSKKDSFPKCIPISEDVFKDIMYCGECGHRMRRACIVKEFSGGDKVRRYSYFCPNKIRVDELSCQCSRISLKKMEEIVLAALEKEFRLSKMKAQDYCHANEVEVEKICSNIYEKQTKIGKQSDELTVKCSELYIQYRKGKINQEQFRTEKKELEEKQKEAEYQLVNLEQKRRKIQKTLEEVNHFIRGLLKCKAKTLLDRDLIQCLIKRINIYSGYRVEIIFNFQMNDILLTGGRNIE